MAHHFGLQAIERLRPSEKRNGTVRLCGRSPFSCGSEGGASLRRTPGGGAISSPYLGSPKDYQGSTSEAERPGPHEFASLVQQ